MWLRSTPQADRYTPGKDSVPFVQKAGWGPGPIWAGAENLVPTGIRSPGRPARKKSLYQPHCLDPRLSSLFTLNLLWFTMSVWALSAQCWTLRKAMCACIVFLSSGRYFKWLLCNRHCKSDIHTHAEIIFNTDTTDHELKLSYNYQNPSHDICRLNQTWILWSINPSTL